MQSVPVTTKVANLNSVPGEVYSIPHYVIKFVSYLPQVGGFPRELRFPPPIKVTATRGVTMLDSSRDVPINKFDKSALITDALYNFRTSLSVVVSFLETPKSDHDEKVALYLNAILKFDLIIALLVAEHILSSTAALTNYLQKRHIDLLEAVRA